MKQKFNDDIRVLAYGDISKLESTMNRHFFDQLCATSDEITQGPSTISELNRYVRRGEFTHVLIPDEWFHRLNGSLDGCNVPVVELLGDHWIPWAVDKKKKYMKDNGIRHTIVFSDRFQEVYGEMVDMHCVLTGYDSSVFRDRGGERDIDVLVHGSLGDDTHKWAYPVRNWLAEILPEIGEIGGFRVEKWGHPGYWPEGKRSDGDFTGLYSDVLNRSKIAIGGSSHWRLALKKFYEVPACGAVLFSDLPLEDRAFFEGRVIGIDSERIGSLKYRENLAERIVNVLTNYEEQRDGFQPFRSEQDRFNRSYDGRSLEIRAVLSEIE